MRIPLACPADSFGFQLHRAGTSTKNKSRWLAQRIRSAFNYIAPVTRYKNKSRWLAQRIRSASNYIAPVHAPKTNPAGLPSGFVRLPTTSRRYKRQKQIPLACPADSSVPTTSGGTEESTGQAGGISVCADTPEFSEKPNNPPGKPVGLACPADLFGFQLHRAGTSAKNKSRWLAQRIVRLSTISKKPNILLACLVMRIEPYQLDELKFAWCNRLYLHTRTHRRRPSARLPSLDKQLLSNLLEPYGIHVIEAATDEIEVRILLSLMPTESVSAAASKTKGRISKWLSEQSARTFSNKSLAHGYFAVTTGQSTSSAVDAYLDQQSEHHGYASRLCPPIFVKRLEHNDEARQSLETDHAVTWLHYHIVMATQFRHGVFEATSSDFITQSWLGLQSPCRFLIEKVSFVPDHVHVAVSLHPAASPASIVLALMNAAQESMWRDFETSVIKARVNRLWQPSAYIGSFGQLSSNAVCAYLHRWSQQRD